MALSVVQYTGDGSNRTFLVTFPYLSPDHVTVDIDGSPVTAFTWLNPSILQLTTPPEAGTLVSIKRSTQQGYRLVDFQDGSVLTESLLDQDSNQNFFLAQEALDAVLLNNQSLEWINAYIDSLSPDLEFPVDLGSISLINISTYYDLGSI